MVHAHHATRRAKSAFPTPTRIVQGGPCLQRKSIFLDLGRLSSCQDSMMT